MRFIDTLDSIDRSATLFLNSCHCPVSDSVWIFFSWTQVWFVLYLLVAVLIIMRYGWKKGLIIVMSIVLTVLCCDQLGNLVKDSVRRLRPCHDSMMVSSALNILEGKGGFYGFYSAHAANSFGFAVCSGKAMKNIGGKSRLYNILIFIWASLVSISRVFVGKHYLGDVLAGAAVGLAIGSIMAEAASLIVSKREF